MNLKDDVYFWTAPTFVFPVRLNRIFQQEMSQIVEKPLLLYVFIFLAALKTQNLVEGYTSLEKRFGDDFVFCVDFGGISSYSKLLFWLGQYPVPIFMLKFLSSGNVNSKLPFVLNCLNFQE